MTFRTFFLLALLALIPLGSRAAEPQPPAKAPAAAPQPTPAPPTAIASVWVGASGAWYRNTPRIDLFIEELRAAPFSEAVIQVVDAQACYYNSLVLPKATGVPESYDPLASLIKGLHARPNPVKVIAWIDPILAGNVGRPQPATSSHVTVAHQDWLSKRADATNTDEAGNMYLELGLPEVRLHLSSMIRELVRGYAIDGIYFDPLGDPGPDWGYHPVMLDAWRQKAGKSGNPEPNDPTWIALRTEAVSQALADMVRAARETNPGIMIGVGVRTDGPPPLSAGAFASSPVVTLYHQDWLTWLTAPGATGRLYLKDFKSESEAKGSFEGWMKFAMEAARPTKMQVMVGVAGRLNESLVAMDQMRRAVENGAAGVVLDNYDAPVREGEAREPFLNAIRNTVLSPDYLATIAGIRRSAKLSEEGPSTATLALGPAPGEDARATTGTQTAAPATTGTQDLALPPPPAPDKAVATGPGPVPGRRIVPSDLLNSTSSTQGSGEVVIRSQRTLPPGAADAMTTEALRQRAAVDAATRRQMLEELTSKPLPSAAGASTVLLEPDLKYKAYLKEKFGNIFD